MRLAVRAVPGRTLCTPATPGLERSGEPDHLSLGEPFRAGTAPRGESERSATQSDYSPSSASASPPTVTWIAAASRTHAMRFSAWRRSSMNWKASACSREA